ncbi:MAG: class I SAM-dependent methyltransferase [Paracoccaceae bacterium]
MRSARLQLALETGAWALPASGDIAVWRPRVGDDLSALPKARVVVRTGFKPDHDHFAAQGYRVAGEGPYPAGLVCLPRAKAEARAMLAEAAARVVPGRTIAVDGQKTDGADAVYKDLRGVLPDLGPSLSKAHGKFFAFPASPLPPDWAATPSDIEGGFRTMPGVFSADGIDRGSALLAAALPAELPAKVGDLGAGWGYLSRAILARQGVKHLDVVEAEQSALDCARHNLPDPRAQFHWADATTFRPDRLWGAVVMNPPFHQGRAADPSLGLAFLQAAHRGLAPDGSLWLVANRHLPYDRTLTALFRNVEDLGGDAAFRLTRAIAPIRAR